MAQRRVENATLAFVTRPGGGIGWTIVFGPFHLRCVNHREHMDVRREILERIPFFIERKIRARIFKTRELWIGHCVLGGLLGAVLDEFAAEKTDISIGLVAVVQVTVGALLRFAAGVEGVAGGVSADEALAAAHVIDQGLLSLRRHGWLSVGAWQAKIAGRVKQNAIELAQVILAELRAVLREDEFPAVPGAQLE